MIRLKNDTQILGIKKSCKLLAQLFDSVLPQIKAGMTTMDIDYLCKTFIESHGGVPAWYSQDFPGAANVSVNNEIIHGVPKKSKHLKDGDIVSVDVGIDLGGYYSDASRTIAIGQISDEAARLIEVTEKCFWAGFEACKVGNRIRDISEAVFDVADSAGYGVVTDYCGHGVGLDVHEDPSVPNYPFRGPNKRIQAGMVLAIEPMINAGTGDVDMLDDGWTVITADGELSSHYENTIAVFPDHSEVLTIL